MYSLFLVCIFAPTSSEIINTNSGSVRGVPSLADDVEAYLGIPYAEPPVGDLRFARPVPKKKWTDVYNASTFGPPCTQISIGPLYFMPDVTNMSEDCLYLNVWSPKSEPSGGLRPIIVYLHPGAYITGSSTIKAHDGSQLASRGDLIVASLNYRLGMFGYFLSYTEEANGNMGEFDKIMAIKWIKENAKYFNGDPDNISLMGASAGAASISCLMLSPLAKDLFKKAIVISGSQMHPSFGDNDRLFSNSERIASIAGCSNNSVNLKSNPRAVAKCLKNKSAEDLVKAQTVLLMTNPLLLFPRVGDELLPKNAVESFREGKFRKDMDVLMGFNENEGGLFLFTGVPQYVGLYGREVKAMTKMRAFALARSAFFLSGQDRASEVIDYYMKRVKNRTTTGYVRMVANILGDFISSCNVIFNADVVSLKGNHVYLYKFDFRPASTPTAEWVGTTHLDDIQYIFGSPYYGNFTPEETELSQRLIDRWSAFARTGFVIFIITFNF